MAYMTIIARASQKYRWLAWVIYDQNFRLEVAGNAAQSWARVDPSIYAQYFTGQVVSSENWCSQCQGLDHSMLRCPYRPQKRLWGSVFGQTPLRASQQSTGGTVCIKFNRYNGDCKFGKQCCFQHVCSGCSGPHTLSKCRTSTQLDPLSKCRTSTQLEIL